MSRSRSNNVPTSNSLSMGYWGSGALGSIDGKVKIDYILSESMVDELSSTNPRPYNAVSHTKIRSSRLFQEMTPGMFRIGNSQPGVMVSYGMPSNAIYVRPSGGYSSSLSSSWVPWDTMVVDMAENVKGYLGEKASLGPFIVDLAKTIRMVRSPFGLLKANWRRTSRKSTARRLAEKGANVWLEYKYGWKPLLKDIRDFARVAGAFMSAHQKYLDRSSPCYYRIMRTSSGSTPSPTMSDTAFSAYAHTLGKSTSNGCVRIKYAAPHLKAGVTSMLLDRQFGQISQLQRIIGALGLDGRGILETLWDIVPFSFVVDWFVNSKNFLVPSQLSRSYLTRVGLRRMGYSHLGEITFTAELWPMALWNCGYPVLNNYTDLISGDLGRVTVYTRSNGLPSGAGAIWTNKGLSISQVLTAAALVVQRL